MFINSLLSDLTIDPLQNITIYNNITVFGIPDYICWIIIGVLLLVSGLFSASENAFSNCNKYHFKVLADEGKITAKIIVRLTEKFENTLVSVLVGNNIVQTIMSFLSAVLFYNICKINGYGDNVEAILSTVVMASLVYIVSDTVPKILSKAIPNRMVYILAWPDFILGILLCPIILIFRGILKLVHKIFKIKDEPLLTKEDFFEQADEAISLENVNNEEEQLFEENEIDIIKNAFVFDKVKVSEVLTPKEKIVSISSDNLNIKDLNNFIMNSIYSRFPVYEGDDKEHIIGILSVNTYFKEFALDPHLDIRSIILKPVFVNQNQSVQEIFDELNKEKVHIGIVFDDNNNLLGMITMEDILDELVGENTVRELKGDNV